MKNAPHFDVEFRDVQRRFEREFVKHAKPYFGKMIGTRAETRKIFAEVYSLVMGDGKRFRPFLLFVGSGRIKKAMSQDSFWEVAVGLELVHAALLIHDDIVDASPLRRGKRSLYRVVGNDRAMIAADAIWSLGLLCIARASTRSAVLKEFMSALVWAGEGELSDMYFLRSRKKASAKEVEMLYTLKTGLYSCAAPLAMGALLAGRDDGVPRLYDIGVQLGILFQLQDDVIDRDPFLVRSGVDPRQYGKRLMGRIERLLASRDVTEESRGAIRYIAAMLYERIQ